MFRNGNGNGGNGNGPGRLFPAGNGNGNGFQNFEVFIQVVVDKIKDVNRTPSASYVDFVHF